MPRRGTEKIPGKKVSEPKSLRVMNPNKGLNNLISPSLIDDREFSDLMNVEYDEGGVLRKRSGYVTAGDALTNAYGLGHYYLENSKQMVTVDNGTLKYRTDGNWSSATGDTFTADKETDFQQARRHLFIWNGEDGGAYFDGSAVTRPGTMPKAKFSIFYQDKHIASGVPGQPSRLYISNVSDATDFTVATGGTQPQPDNTNDPDNSNPNVPGATVYSGTPSLTEANVIDVRKEDGDKITALGIFQDVVIVFKERAIYQLTFDSDGSPTVLPITGATGCVSHKSVVAVENDLFFLSREGHRILGNEPQFFTSIRTQVLSIRIQPTMDTINKQYFDKANATYFDNKWILAVPRTTSAIDRCVVYDRRFSAYTLWKEFNAKDMTKFIDDTTNVEELYFLDDGGTQVYKREDGTYNDNGSAIEAWIVSKAQDFGAADVTKFFTELRLIFRRLSGIVSLTVYEDGNISAGTGTLGQGALRGMGLNPLGVDTLGEDGETSTNTETFADTPKSIVLNTGSRTLKYKIYNNRINENFVLLGNIYLYYPRSPFVFDSSNKIYL